MAGKVHVLRVISLFRIYTMASHSVQKLSIDESKYHMIKWVMITQEKPRQLSSMPYPKMHGTHRAGKARSASWRSGVRTPTGTNQKSIKFAAAFQASDNKVSKGLVNPVSV